LSEAATRPGAARIHVVAGVLEDASGRVLIAQRPRGRPMAGYWEFPGGKLSPGEERLAGLARELDEEVGVRLAAARPLIRYVHRYPDRVVDLDVWRVGTWDGPPHGREDQALSWLPIAALPEAGLLPADEPIVRALSLPSVVLVTPPAAGSEDAFLEVLAQSAAELVVLRRPDLDTEALVAVAAWTRVRTGARVVLNGDPAELGKFVEQGAADGLHVPAHHAARLTSRPLPRQHLFGVSCHDALELDRAEALAADYAFLGPVKPTATHPGAPGSGWDAFARLVRDRPLPVYAIGGLGPADLGAAWLAGAQGIAAIRSLWSLWGRAETSA